MAPRPPESLEQFLARLKHAVDSGAVEVRFGQHHHSHAVCLEDDVWVVRRVECSKEVAEAYLAEHGIFMPEHAEELAEPTAEVARAGTLAELRGVLDARWPW